jgi:MYXO-CTERM domain-containing protein
VRGETGKPSYFFLTPRVAEPETEPPPRGEAVEAEDAAGCHLAGAPPGGRAWPALGALGFALLLRRRRQR